MTHAGPSKVWTMVLAAVLATMLLSTTIMTGARAQEPCTGQVVLDPGTLYSFASGVLLKSEMPATIAETVFITSDREGQLLSEGTGTRQQQIAQALRAGIEDYLKTH